MRRRRSRLLTTGLATRIAPATNDAAGCLIDVGNRAHAARVTVGGGYSVRARSVRIRCWSHSDRRLRNTAWSAVTTRVMTTASCSMPEGWCTPRAVLIEHAGGRHVQEGLRPVRSDLGRWPRVCVRLLRVRLTMLPSLPLLGLAS